MRKYGLVSQCKNMLFKHTIFTYTTKYWFSTEHLEKLHTLRDHLMLSISTYLHTHIYIYILLSLGWSQFRYMYMYLVFKQKVLPYNSFLFRYSDQSYHIVPRCKFSFENYSLRIPWTIPHRECGIVVYRIIPLNKF